MPAQQHDHPQYHHHQQAWSPIRLLQVYKYSTVQRGRMLVLKFWLLILCCQVVEQAVENLVRLVRAVLLAVAERADS
jgi:hypothetical protein